MIVFAGQMRLDGFFCDYKESDKFAFLQKAKVRSFTRKRTEKKVCLQDMGVTNIEMESTCFGAHTHRAGVRG